MECGRRVVLQLLAVYRMSKTWDNKILLQMLKSSSKQACGKLSSSVI